MPLKLSLNRSRQVPAEETPAFGGIAERFRRAGDLDRAITLCREGLRKFPDLLSARVTLGWALLDKGDYKEARTELEFVMRRAPDNLAAIRGLAELHDRAESAPIETPPGWQHQEIEPAAAAPVADADVPAPVAAPPITANAQELVPPVSPFAVVVETHIDPTPVITRVELESPLAAYLTPEPPRAEAVSELDPVLPPEGDWELDPPLPPAVDLLNAGGDAVSDLAAEPVVSLPAAEDLGLEALASQFAAARVEGPSDLFAAALHIVETSVPETADGESPAPVERSEGMPLIPFRPTATLGSVAEDEGDARLERWGALVVPLAPRSANRHTLARLERLLRKVERRRQATSGFVA